jgi:beta-lactamase class A
LELGLLADQMQKQHHIFYFFLTFIGGIILGGALGYGLVLKNPNAMTGQPREVREGGYKFISPLLECEGGNEFGIRALQPTAEELNKRIKYYEEQDIVSHVSIYFRDLNNGPWFGINERDLFEPASLFKVPLLIAFLKESERDPTLLSRQVEFQPDPDVATQNMKPSENLEVGKLYSIAELLEALIINSDNQALLMLSENIDESVLEKVERDLGLFPGESDGLTVSVKNYASIFRVLYNSSYLSRANSEKALELLSRTNFTQGLPSALPEDIVVSHKFGERTILNGEYIVEKQLHDCGIIYYPQHPYLLCVMTRGSDYQRLTRVVKDMSKVVYDSVVKQASESSE